MQFAFVPNHFARNFSFVTFAIEIYTISCGPPRETFNSHHIRRVIVVYSNSAAIVFILGCPMAKLSVVLQIASLVGCAHYAGSQHFY